MTRKSKKIKIGNTFIGGDSPILVQSMLNVPAEDIEGSVKQAVELEKAGCQVIRFAIPNKDALALVEPIKNAVSVPLVADIHFDYKLALGAAERGIDKIRINPGNIGSEDRDKAVAYKNRCEFRFARKTYSRKIRCADTRGNGRVGYVSRIAS